MKNKSVLVLVLAMAAIFAGFLFVTSLDYEEEEKIRSLIYSMEVYHAG